MSRGTRWPQKRQGFLGFLIVVEKIMRCAIKSIKKYPISMGIAFTVFLLAAFSLGCFIGPLCDLVAEESASVRASEPDTNVDDRSTMLYTLAVGSDVALRDLGNRLPDGGAGERRRFDTEAERQEALMKQCESALDQISKRYEEIIVEKHKAMNALDNEIEEIKSKGATDTEYLNALIAEANVMSQEIIETEAREKYEIAKTEEQFLKTTRFYEGKESNLVKAKEDLNTAEKLALDARDIHIDAARKLDRKLETIKRAEMALKEKIDARFLVRAARRAGLGKLVDLFVTIQKHRLSATLKKPAAPKPSPPVRYYEPFSVKPPEGQKLAGRRDDTDLGIGGVQWGGAGRQKSGSDILGSDVGPAGAPNPPNSAARLKEGAESLPSAEAGKDEDSTAAPDKKLSAADCKQLLRDARQWERDGNELKGLEPSVSDIVIQAAGDARNYAHARLAEIKQDQERAKLARAQNLMESYEANKKELQTLLANAGDAGRTALASAIAANNDYDTKDLYLNQMIGRKGKLENAIRDFTRVIHAPGNAGDPKIAQWQQEIDRCKKELFLAQRQMDIRRDFLIQDKVLAILIANQAAEARDLSGRVLDAEERAGDAQWWADFSNENLFFSEKEGAYNGGYPSLHDNMSLGNAQSNAAYYALPAKHARECLALEKEIAVALLQEKSRALETADEPRTTISGSPASHLGGLKRAELRARQNIEKYNVEATRLKESIQSASSEPARVSYQSQLDALEKARNSYGLPDAGTYAEQLTRALAVAKTRKEAYQAEMRIRGLDTDLPDILETTDMQSLDAIIKKGKNNVLILEVEQIELMKLSERASREEVEGTGDYEVSRCELAIAQSQVSVLQNQVEEEVANSYAKLYDANSDLKVANSNGIGADGYRKSAKEYQDRIKELKATIVIMTEKKERRLSYLAQREAVETMDVSADMKRLALNILRDKHEKQEYEIDLVTSLAEKEKIKSQIAALTGSDEDTKYKKANLEYSLSGIEGPIQRMKELIENRKQLIAESEERLLKLVRADIQQAQDYERTERAKADATRAMQVMGALRRVAEATEIVGAQTALSDLSQATGVELGALLGDVPADRLSASAGNGGALHALVTDMLQGDGQISEETQAQVETELGVDIGNIATASFEQPADSAPGDLVTMDRPGADVDRVAPIDENNAVRGVLSSMVAAIDQGTDPSDRTRQRFIEAVRGLIDNHDTQGMGQLAQELIAATQVGTGAASQFGYVGVLLTVAGALKDDPEYGGAKLKEFFDTVGAVTAAQAPEQLEDLRTGIYTAALQVPAPDFGVLVGGGAPSEKTETEKAAEASHKNDLAILARKVLLQNGAKVDVEKYDDGPSVGLVKSFTTGRRDEEGKFWEVVRSDIQYGTETDSAGNKLPTSYEETIKDPATGEEVGSVKKQDITYKNGREDTYQELVTRNIREVNPETGQVEDKQARTLTVVRYDQDGKKESLKSTTVRTKKANEDWGEWKEVDVKGQKSQVVADALAQINNAEAQELKSGGSSNGAKAKAHKKFAEMMGKVEQQLAKLDQLQASMQQKTQEIDRAMDQGQAGFKKMKPGDKVEGQVGEKIEEGEKLRSRQ